MPAQLFLQTGEFVRVAARGLIGIADMGMNNRSPRLHCGQAALDLLRNTDGHGWIGSFCRHRTGDGAAQNAGFVVQIRHSEIPFPYHLVGVCRR